MSRSRTIPLEKKLGYHDLPTGPGGRKLCRWCKTEVPPPKLTFCGEACVHEWRLRSDPNYMRQKVLERDRGVCAHCGLDCVLLSAVVHDHWLPPQGWRRWDEKPAERQYHPLREVIRAWVVELGGKLHGAYWQADHIVPVVEGGGECGLENLRTLCVWCHKRETKELARRRAAARKAE